MNKKKVCLVYLITSFYRGGAETQVARLVRHFTKKYEVHVVSMVGKAGDELEHPELANMMVNVHYLGMELSKARIKDLLATYRLLKQLSPLIVHSHMVHANILARVLKPLVGYKLISTAHNVIECQGKLELLYRFTKGLSNVNTQVSYEGLKVYVESNLFSATDIVIYNGVEREFFSCTGIKKCREVGSVLRILCVAKFRKQKNLLGLLDACLQMKERGIKFSLDIAGNGELFQDISDKLVSTGLADSVNLLGLRSDVRELMQSADVVVLSSDYEGLPMVLIEAAAVGCLVVSTDVGGVKEIVINEETGFLIDQGDMPALAVALEKISQLTPARYIQMSDSAIEHARSNFDLVSIVKKWDELYSV